MITMLRYFKRYWGWLVLLLLLVLVQVYTNLQLPDYTAKIVDTGILNGDTGLILRTGGLMLLISLIGGLATIGVGYAAALSSAGVAKDLRHALFARVESFSLTEVNQFGTASLLTRTTNDVQQVQQVLMMLLRMVVYAPLLGIGAVIKAYQTAPNMSWLMAVAVGVMVALIAFLFVMVLPRYELIQKLVDKLNSVARENLTGLRVIRAFNTEHIEQEKFDRTNREVTDMNLLVNRQLAIMQPVMMLLFNLTTIAIVWVGAHEIATGTLQIGNMLAFMQYAIQTIMAFLFVSFVFIMVPRAAVSARRIAEVLQTQPSVKDPERPVKLAKGNGQIEFHNVTFRYPAAAEPVLKQVSFTAEPGQTTAIIGSTGSGKSTLINLIPRLYDVTEGAVLLDGVDIRTLPLETLYHQLGYVPQKGVLFSGSVISNIRYGDPKADEARVKRAAATAQANEFITKLPERYEAPIAQGGTNVSGGQKQRLSIARALLRDPHVLIFDDSFSALDFSTDAKLRRALKSVTNQRTVIVVAQRMSTIVDAEKIVVLEEGKVVGIGRHVELLKSCSVYREIALSQLSEEELEVHLGAADLKLLKEGTL